MIYDKKENANAYLSLAPIWKEAFALMRSYDPKNFEKGKTTFDNGLSLVQIETQTREASAIKMEAHRKYADLMFMAEGEETLFYKPTNELSEITQEYREDIDALLAVRDDDVTALYLDPDRFAIFLPQDGHAADGMIGNAKGVRRIVIKVPLN